MSDIVEGVGSAVQGALAGRAVEPERGEGTDDARTDNICPNCGAHAPGKFCPECGQKTHLHRTLSAIGHDLMHGVLHLDGKLWRTLPMLVFKPGNLTRRYIEGERASFVSPMAMFLFTVFAMFAVFQMVGLTTPTDFNLGNPQETIREQGEAQADRLRAQIESLPEGDAQRAQREQELQIIEEFLASGSEAEGQAVEAGATDPTTSKIPSDLEDANVEMNVTGIEALDEGILKKWQENPGLMLYKLQANGFKFSWLLIPLSIPFVWLTFAWRRKFKAYDHAIFVTYSLAFMSLLFITASVLSVIPNMAWLAGLLMVLVPPIHIYKQLRGAYQISRFSAFWRLMALSLFIWIVALLFLQALLVLGAL